MITRQEMDVVLSDLNKILQNLSNKTTALEEDIVGIQRQIAGLMKTKSSGKKK